jgi:Flp pilus assembly protein TadD
LAHIAFSRAVWNWVDELPATVRRGIEHGKHAIKLDPKNAFAHCVLGRLLVLAGYIEAGTDSLRRAVALNPSSAYGYLGLGHALMWAGRPGEALPNLERAMRLSPRDPIMTSFLAFTAFCHFMLGQFAAAETAARKSIEMLPDQTWSRLALAAALAGAERLEEARVALDEARQIDPSLSLKSVEPFLRHAPKEHREALFGALRTVGL